MPRQPTSATKRTKALKVYARPDGGPEAAAKIAGVSVRTVQRWAAQEQVRSGYTPQPKVDCPSAAAYARGCRCQGCKDANREAQRQVKQRRIEGAEAGERHVPHGTVSGYSNWDCRCASCRSAWSEYLRERRAARRESVA